MNYILQSDVESYLGVALTPSGVNTFNTLLPLLQEMIDNYCNKTWNFTNPVTENFDALSQVGIATQANYTFFVKNKISQTIVNNNYPLAKGIISVTVGNSPLDMNYIVSYDTYVKLSAAFPSVILANPLGFKMVQIVYNSDDAGNPPPSVKLAFIEWMARKINTASDANKEVVKVQAGTVQAQYAQDRIGGIPDFVRLALNAYRLPTIDHF